MLQSKTYYSYDERGNLSGEQTRTYASEGLAGSTAEQAGLSNDANSVKTYHYDRFNRLVEYTDGDTVAEYEYNADNLRTAKTVNGRRTDYVWDGTNLRYETGGNGTHEYVYDPTGVHMMDGNYYVKDGHGNVTGMYDANAEFVSDTYYDAFGNITYGDAPNPFGYSGEYHDSETGLIYLRNRYYDSTTGRFITEDPAKDGVNWYSYCAGDPVNFVDPNGYLRGPGYNKNGEWSENPDADDYGTNSVAYSALSTLTQMWDNRPNDREVIERLANVVRDTADGLLYDLKLYAVQQAAPESANPLDIIIAVAYPMKALEANDLKSTAEEKADELYTEDRRDGSTHNAFKHAYWNALMSYNLGDDYAQLVGYAHEFGAAENLKPENSDNMNMDLYNNYVGRDIAWNYEKSGVFSNAEDELANKVEFAANNGYLVTIR